MSATDFNIIEKEYERLKSLSLYENELYSQGFKTLAGIDEVGRGPLAGPVMACAVILPPGCLIPGINDSKKLTEKKREALYGIITELALGIGYGTVEADIIDEINILQAARLAMKKALDALSAEADAVLIDGYPVPGIGLPQTSIIGGDGKSISIAAASIMAKVTRDRLMREYDKQYPEYGFGQNKGYGTKAHIAAIERYGLCCIHRRSFRPCFKQP